MLLCLERAFYIDMKEVQLQACLYIFLSEVFKPWDVGMAILFFIHRLIPAFGKAVKIFRCVLFCGLVVIS